MELAKSLPGKWKSWRERAIIQTGLRSARFLEPEVNCWDDILSHLFRSPLLRRNGVLSDRSSSSMPALDNRKTITKLDWESGLFRSRRIHKYLPISLAGSLNGRISPALAFRLRLLRTVDGSRSTFRRAQSLAHLIKALCRRIALKDDYCQFTAIVVVCVLRPLGLRCGVTTQIPMSENQRIRSTSLTITR